MTASDPVDSGLFAAASRVPAAKPFLVGPRRTVTYGDLTSRMGQLATWFRERGIARGDRVLLGVRDDVDTTVLFLSLLRNGITGVLFDPEASERELHNAIDTSDPAGIVADETTYRKWALADHADRRIVLKTSAGVDKPRSLAKRLLGKRSRRTVDPDAYPQCLEGIGESPLPEAIDPESSAYIVFTSGTTSKPKGVEMSHRAVLTHLRTLGNLFDYGEDTHLLNVLPLHHADGSIQGPLMTCFYGGTLFRPAPFNARNVPLLLDTIYSKRITHMIAVPTILSLILRLGGGMEDAFQTDEFRLIVSAAARLDEPLWRNFEERFHTTVCNLYGLTETVTGSLFSAAEAPTRRVGTLGKPVDCEISLLDEAGEPVAIGEAGEIVIRGGHLMTGYFGEPEATAAVLQDGSFKTGDLARVDEDGFYHLVGRARNLIICGGENIAPDEVTSVLESHPGIVEATTLGVADPVWGEKVIACVVVEPGDGPSISQIIDYCRERLSAYKVPRKLIALEVLPRGPSGKVIDSEIRKRVDEASRIAGMGERDLEESVLAIATTCFQTQPGRLDLASGPHNTEGWDSLGHMELVTSLEESFGISLSNREIMKIENLGVAAEIVTDSLAAT